MSSALRIYYIHPLYLGPVTQWGPHLDRCTLQGFNAVLIAPPFKPGPNNDLFLTMDHRSVDPRIGRNNLPRFLSSFAKAARARDLLPMIDLVIDQVAIEALADPELAASYVEALTHDTPDPRLPPSKHGVAVLSPDANLSTLEKWWTERLRAWIDCGIGGFRCLHANRLPLPMLHGIIAAARRHEATTCFLASSCKDAEADPAFFKSAGFDLVTSGSYHWDFKNDWQLHEASGHDAPLPVITMPELPFGKRLAGDHTDDILAQRASVRALRFATETGQGWIMPMGYEFGLTSAMDPIRDCPSFFAGSVRSPRYDISPVISDINREMADRAPSRTVFSLRQITPAYAPVTVMLRTQQEPPITDIVVINPSLAHTASIATQTILAAAALPGTIISDPRNEKSAEHPNDITLASGDVRTFRLLPAPSIKLPSPPARRNAQQAANSPRIAIENVTPSVDEGRFPVKRHVGDDLKVTADIFCDGHDQIAAALLWRPADQRDWNEERMHHEGNDIWSASFPLSRLGRHYFSIIAWKDEFANFSDELEKKHVFGLNVRLELEEGLQLLEATLRQRTGPSADMKTLVQELRAGDDHQRLKIFLAPETQIIMQDADPRAFAVRHPVSFPVEVERRAAGFGSWYEIFPRSQSGDPTRHGTFDDVIARLPAIRDMGFDVLYFPPIHPIGTVNRKGRNNSTTAQPGDPGSPYAIGSAEGGHDALHPELGTLDDFSQLIREAERHGLEIALDFAIQCAPDHPWLQKHPGWFKWRPDGSMRYAENPPKKYEDIVNVDFYAEQAIPDLWLALRDVVLFWVRRGVRIFRVDNPHTKPFPFWEWMISDVRTRHPDVIFLSEAFTRPKVMYRLAKIGFSQSYTYFTWRNQKHELQEYLTELATGPSKDYFRPHFFVNTPDINPIFLQNSGRAGFLIRAVLAGTLSGLFGVYNGFELCEARGIPGKEEYLDSEKYEIRSWDWGREGNIIQEVTLINKIRRSNPALQTHLNVRFHQASNENVLHYSKTTPDRYNLILTAVSLDPFSVQDSDIEIPLWTWDLPDDASIEVEDLMTGQHFIWHGKNQRVRLDPNTRPFFIWRLSPPEGSLS